MPEKLLAAWDALEDQTNAEELKAGWMQTIK